MAGKPYMLEPELEGMPRELLRERQTTLLKKRLKPAITRWNVERKISGSGNNTF